MFRKKLPQLQPVTKTFKNLVEAKLSSLREELNEEVKLIDYLVWLRGYLSDGGKPTHYYDRRWSSWDFQIAWKDFKTHGECGASARNIIVPKGVSYLGGNIGHNTIHYYDPLRDKYDKRGYDVPVYSDPEFEEILILENLLLQKVKKKKKKENCLRIDIVDLI